MSQLGFSTTQDAPRNDGSGRRGNGAVLVAIIALLMIVGIIVALGLRWLNNSPDYPGPGQGEVVVQVLKGDSVRTIGRTLEKSDVVRSAAAFVDAAAGSEQAQSVQPGSYRLKERMKASDALALLLDPASKVASRVVVPEGLRKERTVQLLAKGTSTPLAEYQAALKDTGALGLPPYARGRPEGFLFPATYEIEPSATPADVLAGLVKRFDTAAQDVDLVAESAKTGRNPYDVMIVASLVQAEGRPDDFAKIARVIYNRLDAGMRLQIDATVNYALDKPGLGLTTKDLAVESPYNTYRVKGLPPTPINSPGELAITAALSPEPGNWLYYVTVDPSTGETRFTNSYQEFLRFKAEYQANRG